MRYKKVQHGNFLSGVGNGEENVQDVTKHKNK